MPHPQRLQETAEKGDRMFVMLLVCSVKIEGSGKVEFEHTPEGMRLRTLPYTSGLAS